MVANYFKHNLPSVLDVLIDDTSNSHGQEGVVPTAHKHDSNAKYDSKKWQGPGNAKEKKNQYLNLKWNGVESYVRTQIQILRPEIFLIFEEKRK